MQRPALDGTIENLVRAGERAGLSVEEMIRILNSGVKVETLLNLIERNLEPSQRKRASLLGQSTQIH